MSDYAVSLNDVRLAARRLADVVHKTPTMTCRTLDRIAGAALFLKCEHFQRVGAFKFRGAFNFVTQLSDEEAGRGVVTHSSGNHAQALALSAGLRGIDARIVMPTHVVPAKRRAVEGYGAQIIDCEPKLEAREATAQRVVEETGGIFVHPYDHPRIIAGQGTVALEIFEQVGPLDAIIAPVGGGGLLSGVAMAATEVIPGIRVFGAEPEGADDAARSLAAGELVPQLAPRTIADGLRTGLGEWTWPIIRDRVEGIITVSEEEIVRAMRLTWERAKLLIEPSAAVAVAAALSPKFRLFGSVNRLGIVLSGGNVDLDDLPW